MNKKYMTRRSHAFRLIHEIGDNIFNLRTHPLLQQEQQVLGAQGLLFSPTDLRGQL